MTSDCNTSGISVVTEQPLSASASTPRRHGDDGGDGGEKEHLLESTETNNSTTNSGNYQQIQYTSKSDGMAMILPPVDGIDVIREFYYTNICSWVWACCPRFKNPFPEWDLLNRWACCLACKFMCSRPPANDRAKNKTEAELEEILPIVRNEQIIRNGLEDRGILFTWIGHSTCLVQLNGVNILTDPVFDRKTGPFSFGTKRFRPAAYSLAELAALVEINAVVISHNHYDHFDAESVIEKLTFLGETLVVGSFGTGIKWFVPLGMKSLLRKILEKNRRRMRDGSLEANKRAELEEKWPLSVDEGISELNWWEYGTLRDGQVRVCCVPAQHWSMRVNSCYNRMLWCGWVVLSHTNSFYFAGDTGYNPRLFKKLGEIFLLMRRWNADRVINYAFDLAALPIGAYLPRNFLRSQHMDPEEAVQASLDAFCKEMVPIHWGTFQMGKEGFEQPKKDFQTALAKLNADNRLFRVEHLGSTISVGVVEAS